MVIAQGKEPLFFQRQGLGKRRDVRAYLFDAPIEGAVGGWPVPFQLG